MKHSKYKKNLFRNIKHKIKTENVQLLITNKANNKSRIQNKRKPYSEKTNIK